MLRTHLRHLPKVRLRVQRTVCLQLEALQVPAPFDGDHVLPLLWISKRGWKTFLLEMSHYVQRYNSQQWCGLESS